MAGFLQGVNLVSFSSASGQNLQLRVEFTSNDLPCQSHRLCVKASPARPARRVYYVLLPDAEECWHYRFSRAPRRKSARRPACRQCLLRLIIGPPLLQSRSVTDCFTT